MNVGHRQFAQFEGMDSGGNLAGLDGWGKLKKKLKINKMGKRLKKAAAKVAKVVPGAALVIPSKKGLKNAGKGMAVGAAIGAAVIGGPKAVMAAKKIAEQVKAKKAQEEAEKNAAAEIDRQAAAYEASLIRQDAAASAASDTADTTDAATAAKPSGAGLLLPAALATALLVL